MPFETGVANHLQLKIIFMKRLILSFMFSFLLFGQICLANDTKVPEVVMSLFKGKFQNAQAVSWSESKEYYKAEFILNDQSYCAFYSYEGNFIALSRQISVKQLPLLMQQSLLKKYEKYAITSVVEFQQDDTVTYYAGVENEKNSLIVKAGSSGEWNEYLRTKKK